MQLYGSSFRFTFASALALGAILLSSLGFSWAGDGHAALSHSPIIVARDRNGNPLRQAVGRAAGLPAAQTTSSNWSGFALPSFATAETYTAAQATWIVPAVLYEDAPTGARAEYSANWVGIGGYCENAACSKVDSTLIQLGTSQDVLYNGDTQYYAWYEMLPAAETLIRTIVVHPGDVMTASLACTAPCSGKAEWNLSMTDETSGETWSKEVAYRSSILSAEWIEEAPYDGGILPLADFGTSNFSASTANNVSANLSTGDSVVMIDPDGETSNVSDLATTLDGFNACWGADDTLTPCPAP